MICVVFIHSELKESTSSVVFSFAQSWFSRILPTVAVPLFFFFSGYLFFVGINREGRNRLNLNILLNKLKKRFRTLLIPYLIWNTVVILAFGFLHRFLPSLINSSFENVSGYSFLQLLNCYWKGSGGFPIAYQFWFLRDLMIAMLFSPITYWFVKKSAWVILVLTILYLIGAPYLRPPFYYFACGAYFSLQRINFILYAGKIRYAAIFVAIISAIVYYLNDECAIGHRFFILSAAISLAGCSCLSQRNGFTLKMNSYSQALFFVYAYHGLPILLSSRLLVRFIPEQDIVLLLVAYFFYPLIITAVGVGIYMGLKRTMPGLLNILTGGR